MPLTAKPLKKFRVTYRMEVYVQANTEADAIATFEDATMEELASESTYVSGYTVEEEEA